MTEVNTLEGYYLNLTEPEKSSLLFLRKYLLQDPLMSEGWKYSLPFFIYKNNTFCYFWREKKSGTPYISFTRSHLFDHPVLIQGNRKKLKVLHFDPQQDLPMKEIEEVVELAKRFY